VARPWLRRVAFLAVERLARRGRWGLLRNPCLSGAHLQLAAFATSGLFIAVIFSATVYLGASRHLIPISAGLVYLPSSAPVVVVCATSVLLLPRFALRTMIPVDARTWQ
jgi:hypothetical protein